MTMALSDVSDKLGEYMLKGWVLTDQSCPTFRCTVPLIRSPTGRSPTTHLCVKCDGSATNKRPEPSHLSAQATPSSMSSNSHASRSSTPPTEVSSTLSSPIFAPPAETDESRRRREQSDRASSEIGKRLLKGWAMLGDECPNARCYGVPLVRPPKPGGEKDPRKECVICGTVYVTEADWAGRERLVNVDASIHNPGTNETSNLAETTRPEAQQPLQTFQPIISSHGTPSPLSISKTDPSFPLVHPTHVSVPVPSIVPILDETVQALQLTLQKLSSRLASLSGGSTISDLSSIGITAETITKITHALVQVRQLQQKELQT